MDLGKIIIIAFLILIVPSISALTGEKDSEIELKIPFEVDGSAASSSAWCNVSVDFPNTTTYIDNYSMVNNDNGIFSTTLNQTSSLGTYPWTAFCCDGSNCAAGYGEIFVTPSGTQPTTAQAIVYFIALLVVIILLGVALYGGITIQWGNNMSDDQRVISINDKKYMKLISWIMAYMLVMFLFAILKGITGDFLFINNAYVFFDVGFEVLLRLIIPVLIAGAWIAIFHVISDKKTYKMIQRVGSAR